MEQAHHNSILAHPTMLPGEGDTTVELSTVTTCLSEIEALVKSTWQSNIRFDLQASQDMPVVPCSRMELQGALMNLLINAPFTTVTEAASLGVRRISVGGTLARTAWQGFLEAATEIAEEGTFTRFEQLPNVDGLWSHQ